MCARACGCACVLVIPPSSFPFPPPRQELLVGMGGCAPTAELSDHQLQRLAGGPVLQYICLQMSASASKKPVRRLRDMLLAGTGSGALITPLFLLICKQFNVVLSHANGPLGTPTPLKVCRLSFPSCFSPASPPPLPPPPPSSCFFSVSLLTTLHPHSCVLSFPTFLLSGDGRQV